VIRRFEVNATGLPERGVKIQVWLRADGFDPILEELSDRLGSFEAGKAQFVLAERRREFADPPVLGWSISHEERSSLPLFRLPRVEKVQRLGGVSGDDDLTFTGCGATRCIPRYPLRWLQ
jgi:hypothetical protein